MSGWKKPEVHYHRQVGEAGTTTMMSMSSWLCLLLLFTQLCSTSTSTSTSSCLSTPPPLPVLPIPSQKQLKWQRRERALFMHFGMNTFTDSEWGTGRAPPSVFSPGPHFSPAQWVSVAKAAGFKLVILTVKHHDGFCLWPSRYTNYSVQSSTWRNGTGDVVKELVAAATQGGVEVGLYLSPWDRHESSYGNTVKYNEFYLAQMRELLTNYGSVSEVWLDGAKGDNVSMDYLFQSWFDVVHQLQPDANIFSDAGPDVRWVGDEQGRAGKSCWSMVNRNRIQIGRAGQEGYLNQGDEQGPDWIPPECDVSIRPGWFWHKNEKPKQLKQLLDIYYQSVGRNCVLLLNVPPSSAGLIEDEDARVLGSFSKALESIFSVNLVRSVKASSERSQEMSASKVLSSEPSRFWSPAVTDAVPWIEVEAAGEFNVVRIEEAIEFGQRVSSHRVEVWDESKHGWVVLVESTTVGSKRLHLLGSTCSAKTVRLLILAARASPPLISSFGLHLDSYSNSSMNY